MKPSRILALLALAVVGWLAYAAYLSPEGRAKAADRTAIKACRAVDLDANLSVIALDERRRHCDRLEAAYAEKWR